MSEYKFEIHGSTSVIVEGKTAEEARMTLIEDPEIYREVLLDDCYISDGEEVE